MKLSTLGLCLLLLIALAALARFAGPSTQAASQAGPATVGYTQP